MRGARVIERSAERATSQLFLSAGKVHDLAREERDSAHVLTESLPPLESEFASGKSARRTGVGGQEGLDEAEHRLQTGGTRWERGVDQVVILARQEASEIRRGSADVLPRPG